MNFYIVVHILMGISTGAAAHTQKLAGISPSQAPKWAYGPLGSLSATFAFFAAVAAVITTAVQYPIVWALATLAELVAGAFIAGLIPTGLRFLFALIAIPLNVVILGALWGFWYIG